MTWPAYESPYNYRRSYAGQSPIDERCPICGSSFGECDDAAPISMPLPAFEIGDVISDRPGPLRLYEVTIFGFTSRMQLSDADAARYGDAAALIP
jgi:hypothetical protein